MTSPGTTAALGGPEIDEAVLRRLFDLAGPEQSAEILDRLNLDLRAVLKALARSPAVAELRRQIHVLIGIAGTVGALRLHQEALSVGKALREEAEPDARQLTAPLLPLTERLIDRLAEMRATM